MNLNKKFNKLVCLCLSFLLVVMGTIIPIKSYASEKNLYDGSFYKLESLDYGYKITDKITKEYAIISYYNQNKMLVTYDNGDKDTFTRDENNSIYKNNIKVKSDESIIKKMSFNKDDNKIMLRSNYKWIYLNTIYGNTSTDANIKSIMMGLFSFVPYVGFIGTLISIVDACKNLGSDTLYYKKLTYYIKGYSRYKYVTYFYADKAMTKFIKKTTVEKQMW